MTAPTFAQEDDRVREPMGALGGSSISPAKCFL